MKAFRVVASANQQSRRSVGTDPKTGQQLGRGDHQQGLDPLVEFGDLVFERLDPPANELSDILWAAITGSPDRDARNRDASLTKTETVRPFNRQRSWSGAVITR